jgi:hypothetical protein
MPLAPIVRCRHPLLVQDPGDRLEGVAGRVPLEDTQDDLRLIGRDHPELPRVLRVGRIRLANRGEPKGLAAGREARDRAALEAPVRLGPDELEKGVVHERQRAEGQARASRV